MIERIFTFSTQDTSRRLIEDIVHDPDLHLTRIVLQPGAGFFNENTTSNDYLIVVSGQIGVKLGSQQQSTYPEGTVICIPPYVQIEVENPAASVLEFLLIKAPSPERYETLKALEQDSSYLTFCTYILYSCRVLGSPPQTPRKE
ncbi:hypothetical protein GF359_09115 [candidate division WOR-3 bacterium]|uniref:Cupin domain-containing protein n=1 Tax=candidate division WOR-3 bacterium TaxID=2052148 RepID=A0A9D5KA89_UNCW3|nr:hypothetical protein [candidate division WOR-3 bacterium]MBD3365358.1 hypothetical protein [candidate division WOR-3 bacterium]